MNKHITSVTTIQDILNIIDEPKEVKLRDLKNNGFVRKYIKWDGHVDGLSSHYKSRFKKIKEVDLKYPTIITTKDGEYNRIIDGHHRILKTIQSNLSIIKISTVNLDGYSDEDARLAVFLINALFKNTRHNIHKKY